MSSVEDVDNDYDRKPCCACAAPKNRAESKRMLGLGAILLAISIAFFIIGALLPAYLQESLDNGIAESESLDSTDTVGYAVFEDNSDFPLQLDVFMYNLTNADDVLAGAKPHLVEVGPFHYDVYRKALDTEWDEKREQISWKYYTYYEFDLEKSVMSDDTVVTNLNMPFWGTVYAFKARGGDQALDMILPNVYPEDDPDRMATMGFTVRPVREHLFGYDDDPLLAFMNAMGMGISATYDGIIANYTSPDDARTRVTQPDTIMTGFPDIADLHQYRKYLGEEYLYNVDPTSNTKTQPWVTLEDGAVVGSDGAAFPTPMLTTDSPGLFVPSFYRPVNLTYEGSLDFKTLKVHKFQIPDAMWASSETVPSNSNYFQDEYEGLLNISSCVSAVPLIVTRPRFAGVSAEVRDMVELEGPTDASDDVADNNSYFYVEPHTGMTMNVVSASLLALHTQNIKIRYDDSVSATMSSAEAQRVLHTARASHTQTDSPMSALLSATAATEPALSFAPHAPAALATLGSATVQSAALTLLAAAHDDGLPRVAAGEGEIVEKDLFPDLGEAYIPLFFANQTAGIDQEGAESLARTLYTLETVINGTPAVAYTIAVCLVLLAAFFLARGRAGYKRFRDADLYFVGSDDTAGRFSRVDLTSIAALDAESQSESFGRFRAGSYDTIALGRGSANTDRRYGADVTMDAAASPSSMYASTSPVAGSNSQLVSDDHK